MYRIAWNISATKNSPSIARCNNVPEPYSGMFHGGFRRMLYHSIGTQTENNRPSYFDRPFVWESSDSTSRRTAIRKSTGRVAAKSSRRNHRRRRRTRRRKRGLRGRVRGEVGWGEVGRGAGDAPRANSLPRGFCAHRRYLNPPKEGYTAYIPLFPPTR